MQFGLLRGRKHKKRLQVRPRPSPRHTSSFIERITFFWAWPLLRKGVTSEGIRPEDLPWSPDRELIESKCKEFLQRWHDEAEVKGDRASLISVISRVYGCWFMAQAVPCVVSECCGLLTPVLLKYVLDDVQAARIDNEKLAVYSAAFFAMCVVQALFVHNMWMNLVRVGLAVRYALVMVQAWGLPSRWVMAWVMGRLGG